MSRPAHLLNPEAHLIRSEEAQLRSLATQEARVCPAALVHASLNRLAIVQGIEPARKVARAWLGANRLNKGVPARPSAELDRVFGRTAQAGDSTQIGRVE